MLSWINKKRNKKGFTLIELIVVIAILGILLAIAIPRFANIRQTSAIKADAATAAQIVNAARIQETDTGFAVTGLNQAPGASSTDLKEEYIIISPPQAPGTNGVFAITSGSGGQSPYKVNWAAVDGKTYTVTEGQAFDIGTDGTTP